MDTSGLTPHEAALLRKIVEGGGPDASRADSIALTKLYNEGLITIKRVYSATDRGVEIVRGHVG